jgi:mannitol-1-phosphate/altronate dehydrogenase
VSATLTFGVICAAAAARFQRGIRPFTLMSCDNLPHNGEVCKVRLYKLNPVGPLIESAWFLNP